MMSKKLLSNAVIALTAGFIFVSCNEDSDPPFEIATDVYYVNRIIDEEVRTGVAYYAYGNEIISAATVTPPGGETIDLGKIQNLSYTWFKEPEIEEYMTERPAGGTYEFEVTSQEGEILSDSDVLEADTLGIPSFSEIEFLPNQSAYEVKWDELDKAQAYVVKILDSAGDIVFTSYTLNEDATDYDITQSGAGQWVETPTNGETYTFQLHAFTFDDEADQNNYIYNFQEISVGETEVVWGE